MDSNGQASEEEADSTGGLALVPASAAALLLLCWSLRGLLSFLLLFFFRSLWLVPEGGGPRAQGRSPGVVLGLHLALLLLTVLLLLRGLLLYRHPRGLLVLLLQVCLRCRGRAGQQVQGVHAAAGLRGLAARHGQLQLHAAARPLDLQAAVAQQCEERDVAARHLRHPQVHGEVSVPRGLARGHRGPGGVAEELQAVSRGEGEHDALRPGVRAQVGDPPGLLEHRLGRRRAALAQLRVGHVGQPGHHGGRRRRPGHGGAVAAVDLAVRVLALLQLVPREHALLVGLALEVAGQLRSRAAAQVLPGYLTATAAARDVITAAAVLAALLAGRSGFAGRRVVAARLRHQARGHEVVDLLRGRQLVRCHHIRSTSHHENRAA
mmetsp:Transcript_12265/g.16744  ORF Transcript_12265/g.16744 Transcript_12265/m.16744 type:complete len:378 (+) Transcript_12265:358-1491(+)